MKDGLFQRWVWLVLLSVVLLGCRPEIPPPPRTPGAEVPLPFGEPEVPSRDDMPIAAEISFASDGDLYTSTSGPAERLPLFASLAYETSPAWSPVGRYLAFAYAEDGPADLSVAAFDEGVAGERVNLTQSPDAHDLYPTWSPDGRYIAYASHDRGNWGLFRVELEFFEGKPIPVDHRRLTYSQLFHGHPSWSPVGSDIAFTADMGDRWQILVTDSGGRGPSVFPGMDSYTSSAYPAWSPDGRRLAFASMQSGDWDIYVINTDGTELIQLTAHPAMDWGPSWSPDGRWIAFSTTRNGAGDVYLVRANGSELIRWTGVEAYDHAPAWRPVYLTP